MPTYAMKTQTSPTTARMVLLSLRGSGFCFITDSVASGTGWGGVGIIRSPVAPATAYLPVADVPIANEMPTRMNASKSLIVNTLQE